MIYQYVDKDIGISQDRQKFARQISAYAMFGLWTKLFYWTSLFDEPAYYVVQIFKTLTQVKYFAILFVIVLFSFASYFFIL
jgi:hypothetical protein